MPFSTIVIVYNPNSTGPSKQLAEECASSLQQALTNVSIRLQPTERAGHAEELAYELANSEKRPLIISSSGDGGYHEVVNGIMRAGQEGKRAVAGLLPGGNANDHYNSVHDRSLVKRVVEGQVETIDVLKLEGRVNGQSFLRYAHSYIGLGLTPKVGRELTKTRLNRWNELAITLRWLVRPRSTALLVDGQPQKFRSLVFTNIDRMAKVLNLAHQSRADDGAFEVSAMPTRSRLHMLGSLFKASTLGLTDSSQTKNFTFKTVKPTLIQLDGEVFTLDAGTEARVNIEPHALDCIV